MHTQEFYTTQYIKLNYHWINTSLTKGFHWLLSASSVCHPSDVIGDYVRDYVRDDGI